MSAERHRVAHEPAAPHKNEAATSDEARELRHGWGGEDWSLPDEIETVTFDAALSSSPSKVVAGSASTRKGFGSQVSSTSSGTAAIGHKSSAGDRKGEEDGYADKSAVWGKYGGDMSTGVSRRQLSLLDFKADFVVKKVTNSYVVKMVICFIHFEVGRLSAAPGSPRCSLSWTESNRLGV